VGYLTLNEPGLIQEANLTAANLLGVARSELRQRPLSRFVLREDADIYDRHRRQLLETRAPQSCELRMKRPGATPFWVRLEASVPPGSGGAPPVCRATLSDITRHKQAEADRERLVQLERLAQLMKCANDVILLTDEDGRILEANDRALETYGYSLAELRQKTVEDLRTPESRAELPHQAEQLETDGRAVYEAMNQRRDGVAFPVEISARFLQIAGVRYRLGIVRDITERKRAEERVQMLSREIIVAREEERKRVSSVLHHDVGSMAVGVAAHLDALEEDLRSGRAREALKWMRRTRKLFGESVVRLKKLAIKLRPPELDVLGLCAALRQHFAQAAERGGIRIHFRETLGRRRVSGDTATILFRIAQEALTNAVTHGHATRVDVGLSASKTEVALTARNNGKAFNPSGKTGRVKSHLGLRVMREMALSAGGVFTVDSGRGKGTTVRVRLPIAD
jgi:PAS domain S-box-containing protein